MVGGAEGTSVVTDSDPRWLKPAARVSTVILNAVLVATFFIVVIGLIERAVADPDALSVILAVCGPVIGIAAMMVMKLLLRAAFFLATPILVILLAPVVAIFTNPFED